MSSNKTALARVVLSLFAGMMFWSSWSLQGARHAAAPAGGVPYLQLKAFERATGMPEMGRRQWKKMPAAEQRRRSQELKVEMGQRLSRVVSDPAQIKQADLEAVKVAWGSDSSKMLALLRASAD
jgi:hypothetical protein